MDGLHELVEDIMMMQMKTFVIVVTCKCGKTHRVPLDGYRICEVCGRKVLSPILTGELK